jgi:CYTH domain-containing protein/CHAD domain-containing protein
VGALAAIGIERKFLVEQAPADLGRLPAQRISQGYLLTGDEVEVRARRHGERTTLTIKPGLGRARQEEEIAIEPEQFARLWALTEGRRVEKVRCPIPAGEGLTIELDRYAGGLEGLATVEVEFDSQARAEMFEPPHWFGPEVTEDPRYKSHRLARDGAPKPPRAEPEPMTLRRGEAMGAGIRRVVRGQIDLAIDQLGAGAREDPGHAVHACRKAYKRVRAVLRLVRDELGDETYRRENAAFRDLGRQLSGARDSQVMIETLDALRERHVDELHSGAFGRPRARLVADHKAGERRIREDTDATASVIADLRAARRRVAAWDFRHDGIDALAPGFERIYRRGRRAFRAARKDHSDENFHELRKRTKDLWYAAQILTPVAPKAMHALTDRTRRLSELVGEDHDLAVLAQHAVRHPDWVADYHEAALLDALIHRQRREVQHEAVEVASRTYANNPARLVRRLKRAPDYGNPRGHSS